METGSLLSRARTNRRTRGSIISRLSEALNEISPLAGHDPDLALDLQAALEQVYADGRYARRVRYDTQCQPRPSAEDQAWADERITAFRAARADLFPG